VIGTLEPPPRFIGHRSIAVKVERDAQSARRQRPRDRPTDAARRAGDERRSAPLGGLGFHQVSSVLRYLGARAPLFSCDRLPWYDQSRRNHWGPETSRDVRRSD